MHLPEFALLVIATIAAIAAGLVMVASNYRAARVLAWIAALSFGSLGIVWSQQSHDYPLATQMLVAAVCAGIAAAALVWGLSEIRGRAVAGEQPSAGDKPMSSKNSPNISAGRDVNIGHLGDVINQGPPARHITLDQVQKFIGAMPGISGERIGIRLQDGSNEGRQYAVEIMNLFRQAGWQVLGGLDTANTLPGSHRDVVVEVGEPIPAKAKVIVSALNAAGITTSTVRGPWPEGMDVYRVVIWPAK